MNPESLLEAKKIVTEVKRGLRTIKNTQVVVCPPFVYISPLSGLQSDLLMLGAQNANADQMGSRTGEVSFSQLPQFNIGFVIVGHSERRKMGEDNELVNKKVKSVVSEGMTAIICVGENTRDNGGEYFNFIKEQISCALKDVPKKLLTHVVIAYEPVWAIGATALGPSELHEMSIYIKKVLKDLFGVFSSDMRIIYGGDVDRNNADRLVKDGNVSGVLVGRASLRPKDFVEIIKLIDSI